MGSPLPSPREDITLLGLLPKMNACGQEGYQIQFLQQLLKAPVLRLLCWEVM